MKTKLEPSRFFPGPHCEGLGGVGGEFLFLIHESQYFLTQRRKNAVLWKAKTTGFCNSVAYFLFTLAAP
jgi:hypothetical protein